MVNALPSIAFRLDQATIDRIDAAAQAAGLSRAAYILQWIPEAQGALVAPSTRSEIQARNGRAGQRKRRERLELQFLAERERMSVD
jgi:uncharacterized protein (DUF1778 family)